MRLKYQQHSGISEDRIGSVGCAATWLATDRFQPEAALCQYWQCWQF
jgi:hypothetical protein